MLTILVVDDTAIERRRAGALLEKKATRDFPPSPDLRVVYAGNGKEAMAALDQAPVDLVLTDLQMPQMNGLELVLEVRTRFPAIPVILMTAHGSEEIASQALQLGAAGYVPKKHLVRDLRETIDNVLELTQNDREQKHVVAYLQRTEAEFQLPNDLALISPVVAYLQNSLQRLGLLDEVGELRVTIALRETLVNAITHGNLEVASTLRETDDKAYRKLLDDRRKLPPYSDRRVHLLARESPEEVVYVIRDEGPGFDPASLPDPTDPANLEKCSGRGLFLIRTFMDDVRHGPKGNEITLCKRKGR